MAEEGSNRVRDEVHTLESIRIAHAGLEKRVDDLTREFRQFVLEMRQEFLRARNGVFQLATTPGALANTPAAQETSQVNRFPRRPQRIDLHIDQFEMEENRAPLRFTPAAEYSSDEDWIRPGSTDRTRQPLHQIHL